MKLWMIAINIASEELDEIDANAKFEGKKAAWSAFIDPVVKEQELVSLLEKIANSSNQKEAILNYASSLSGVSSDKKRNSNCST
jgi:hypothetical protein